MFTGNKTSPRTVILSEFGSREAGDEESKDPKDVSAAMLLEYSSTMKIGTYCCCSKGFSQEPVASS